MPWIWAILASFGFAASAWMVVEIERRPRPGDLAFALILPLCIALAFAALVSVFVPKFLEF